MMLRIAITGLAILTLASAGFELLRHGVQLGPLFADTEVSAAEGIKSVARFLTISGVIVVSGATLVTTQLTGTGMKLVQSVAGMGAIGIAGFIIAWHLQEVRTATNFAEGHFEGLVVLFALGLAGQGALTILRAGHVGD